VLKIGPSLRLHAFSPDEVCHAVSSHNLSSAEVLTRLKGAGLGSLQGTAAEILVNSVRKVICPRKLDTAEWVRIIKEAHALGIPSTATIVMDRMRQQEIGQSIWGSCAVFRMKPMVLLNWFPCRISASINLSIKRVSPALVQPAGKIC
jgi:hypothetical protein